VEMGLLVEAEAHRAQQSMLVAQMDGRALNKLADLDSN